MDESLPISGIKQKKHNRLDRSSKNFPLFEEIQKDSQKLKPGEFSQKIYSIEQSVSEEIHEILKTVSPSITEADYLIISQGSCNTNEFDINSSDIDIEIILNDKQLSKKLSEDVEAKKKLVDLQNKYKFEDEPTSRMKFWPTSLENMLSDDFKGTLSLACDSNDGWCDLAGQILQNTVYTTGKFIKGNKEKFFKLREKSKTMKPRNELGPELHYTALFDFFEGVYGSSEGVDAKKIAKAALRATYAAYISFNGEFLNTYANIYEAGERFFGVNNISDKMGKVLGKMYNIKKGSEEVLTESDLLNIWNLFKIYENIQKQKLRELAEKDVSSERVTKINNFVSERLIKSLSFSNFDNIDNSSIKKMYVDNLVDVIFERQKTDDTIKELCKKEDIFDMLMSVKEYLSAPDNDDDMILRGKIENILGEYQTSLETLKTVPPIKELTDETKINEKWDSPGMENKIIAFVSVFANSLEKVSETREGLEAAKEKFEECLAVIPTSNYVLNQIIRYSVMLGQGEEIEVYGDIKKAINNKDFAYYLDSIDGIVTNEKWKQYKSSLREYIKNKISKRVKENIETFVSKINPLTNYAETHLNSIENPEAISYGLGCLKCESEIKMKKFETYLDFSEMFLKEYITHSGINEYKFVDYHHAIDRLTQLDQKEYEKLVYLDKLDDAFGHKSSGSKLLSESSLKVYREVISRFDAHSEPVLDRYAKFEKFCETRYPGFLPKNKGVSR